MCRREFWIRDSRLGDQPETDDIRIEARIGKTVVETTLLPDCSPQRASDAQVKGQKAKAKGQNAPKATTDWKQTTSG